jgi:hypothetical protein
MPSDTPASLAPVQGPTASTGSTTTTIAPTTTLPATTTTTVVADATTADPHVLAQQLQSVLDRYRTLYSESRANPELPFTDETFVQKMLDVVTHEYYGVSLIPAWTQYRSDKQAVRDGPSGQLKSVVTAILPLDDAHVEGQYCTYDDSVTYSLVDSSIVDESIIVQRATGTFVRDNATWRLDRVEMGVSDDPSNGSRTCLSEANP